MSYQKFREDAELESLQFESFDYFLNEVNPLNGLILDKTAPHWPASIAATGFALAAYPVAVERHFMSRSLAIERTLNTLRFFWNSPQSPEPDATGYKGFYYHFLDMKTGRRAWKSELSTIDSSFLIAGMLTAGCYFDGQNAEEQEIRELSEALYTRVDWQWAQNQKNTVTLGWRPETDFLPYWWDGFDEALLLYILGLGSPSHPLPESSYIDWGNSYEWKNIYGIEYLYAGPLFTHHYSHMWVDFKNIQDAFMRKKKIDYFENSRRATYVHQQYCIRNPLDYKNYFECCWGLTASDGPGHIKRKIDGIERQFYNYVARGAPYGPDDGTISPWASVASLPFAPEIVLPLIDHFVHELKLKLENSYGFKASFNKTYRNKKYPEGWISEYHFGINQGPIVLMIENYRSGLLWSLMKKCPFIIQGLKRAGFTGGYLS